MSKPAARVGDLTMHGGSITGPGCPTVLIGNMPAATAGDMHVCPMFNGPQPHVGGAIAMGSATVLIGGKPAARQGDNTGHGGVIVQGFPTVQIGG